MATPSDIAIDNLKSISDYVCLKYLPTSLKLSNNVLQKKKIIISNSLVSKSTDSGFDSPRPESRNPPPRYKASLTHNTFIHTWLKGYKGSIEYAIHDSV